MAAPPTSQPMPSIAIEDVPDRPDNFLPLGSGGNGVEESIMEELKEHARLAGTTGRPSNGAKDLQVMPDGSSRYSVQDPWSEGRRMVEEQSCISAN